MKLPNYDIDELCYVQGYSLGMHIHLSRNKIKDTEGLVAFLKHPDTRPFSPYYTPMVQLELLTFYDRHIESDIETEQQLSPGSKDILWRISSLTQLQTYTFLLFFETRFSFDFPESLKEPLIDLCGLKENFTPNFLNMIVQLFSGTVKAGTHPGIGKKSAEKIEALKAEVLEMIRQMKGKTRTTLIPEYLQWVLGRKNPFKFKDVEIAKLGLIDSEGRIKLFKLINLFFQNRLILYGITREIFHRIFIDKKLDILAIEALAKKHNLSLPEITKRISELEVNFSRYFDFLEYFTFYKATPYDIYGAAPCFLFTEKMTEQIEAEENVTFNSSFITKVLGLLLCETHVQYLFANGDLFQGDGKIDCRTCFVRKPLDKLVDIRQLKDDLERITKNKHEGEKGKIIRRHIKSLLDADNMIYLDELCDVADIIVEINPSMKVDELGNLIGS